MSARDKIGHALRFANRVTRRTRDSRSSCSEEDTKPAPATPLAQPIAPAPSQARPVDVQSILQVQSMGQFPIASFSTPLAGLVLGQGARCIMVNSSFAPLGHGCETYQGIKPSPAMMPSSVAMCSMGEPQGEMFSLLQKIAPSHDSLSDSISLMNSALCDSMHTTSQGDCTAQGLDVFEKGDLTEDWDFDAEILSVLF
jgi:hypothetical protein